MKNIVEYIYNDVTILIWINVEDEYISELIEIIINIKDIIKLVFRSFSKIKFKIKMENIKIDVEIIKNNKANSLSNPINWFWKSCHIYLIGLSGASRKFLSQNLFLK